jgi:acid stress-induced BolA-like protein IbaG/YrbA
MESVKDKLRRVIVENLREASADLETLPNGRIVGHIISSDFDGLSYAERRERLWRVIDEEMNREEVEQLSTLLTYTPEEWNIPLQSD